MARRPRYPAAAGELLEVVTIEAPSTTLDEAGSSTVSYSTVWTARARVRTVRAPEGEVAERQAEYAIYEVTVRYRPGLLPTYRVTWRARPLQIVEIRQPDEREAFIVLVCRDAQPNPGTY